MDGSHWQTNSTTPQSTVGDRDNIRMHRIKMGWAAGGKTADKNHGRRDVGIKTNHTPHGTNTNKIKQEVTSNREHRKG